MRIRSSKVWATRCCLWWWSASPSWPVSSRFSAGNKDRILHAFCSITEFFCFFLEFSPCVKSWACNDLHSTDQAFEFQGRKLEYSEYSDLSFVVFIIFFFRQEEQNIHPENQEHVRAVRQQLQTEQVTSAVPVPKNKWFNIQVCQDWLVCLSVCLTGSGWNLSGGGQAAILHRHVVSSVFAAGRPSRWNQLWAPVLRWESPANKIFYTEACRVTLSSSLFVFLNFLQII